MLAEHLPPGSHALRGGGWGGQELQAPAQLRPPRAKASRAARAPGGSTARCIQPGQQWPQEPWRSGTAPCPSSLGRRSSSSRSDKTLPLDGRLGLSQPIPASVRTSSHRVGELRGSGQSQDFLSPQKANHHPCLRLSNSPVPSALPLPPALWVFSTGDTQKQPPSGPPTSVKSGAVVSSGPSRVAPVSSMPFPAGATRFPTAHVAPAPQGRGGFRGLPVTWPLAQRKPCV